MFTILSWINPLVEAAWAGFPERLSAEKSKFEAQKNFGLIR